MPIDVIVHLAFQLLDLVPQPFGPAASTHTLVEKCFFRTVAVLGSDFFGSTTKLVVRAQGSTLRKLRYDTVKEEACQ